MPQTLPIGPWRAPRVEEKTKRGFTLIELAVAVTVLALGTTLAVVYLDALLPQSKVQAAARNLGAQIGELRSSAITQGYSYFIEYDLDQDAYRVITPFKAGGGLAQKPEDRIAFEWNLLPERVQLLSVTIGGGEAIERGIVSVEFDPLGSAIEHDIFLFMEKPETELTLHVDGLTGMARFHLGKPDIKKVDDADFR